MSKTSELHKKYKEEEKQAKLYAKIEKYVKSEIEKISNMGELERDIYMAKLSRKKELLEAKIVDLKEKQQKLDGAYDKELSDDAISIIAGVCGGLALMITAGALAVESNDMNFSSVLEQFGVGAFGGFASILGGVLGLGLGGICATSRPFHKLVTISKLSATETKLENNDIKLQKYYKLKNKLDGLGIER